MIHRFLLVSIFSICLGSAHAQIIDPLDFECNYHSILKAYQVVDSLDEIKNPDVLLHMAQQAIRLDSLEQAALILHRIVDRPETSNTIEYFLANTLLHYRCDEQIEITQLKEDIKNKLGGDHSLLDELELFEYSKQFRGGEKLPLDKLVLPILNQGNRTVYLPMAYMRAHRDLISYYESQNQSQKSIETSQKLVVFAQKNYPSCSRYVAYAQSVLAYRFSKFNVLDSSDYYYGQAYELYKTFHAHLTGRLGNTLNSLIRVAMRRGYSGPSIELLNKEIPFIETINKNEPYLSTLYNTLGVNYNRMGKSYEAIEAYQKSLLIAEQGTEDYTERKIISFVNIAAIYVLLGENDKGLSYLNVAEAQCLSEYGDKNRYIANIYSIYAQLYHDKKEWEKCFEFTQKNVNIIQELYGNNHYQLINPLRSHALSSQKLGNLDDAKANIERALSIARAQVGETHYITARLYKNKAAILIDREEFIEAIESIRFGVKSLDCRGGKISGCLDASIYLALLEEELRLHLHPTYSQNNLDTMLAIVRESEDVFDYIRTQIPSISNMADQAKVFELHHENAMHALVLAYEQRRTDSIFSEAISFIEKTKNFDLLGYMQIYASDLLYEVPADSINRLNRLQRAENSLNEILAQDQSTDASIRMKFRDSLVAIQDDVRRMEQNLVSDHPEYYELRTQGFKLDVEELQQSLDNVTALLDYTLTDSFLICFIITENQVQTARIPITRFQLAQKVEMLNYRLANPGQDYSILLQSLSALAKPFNELADGISRVIIVPDNHTFGLPFDLLLLNDQPLWERFDISYANSASIYHLQSKKKKYRNGATIAAFAPTYSSEVDTAEQADLAALVRAGKWRLPFAEEEALSVAKFLGGRSYVGDQVSKDRFTEALVDYDIMHLSMHAELNENDPMSSRLLFDATGDNPMNNLQLHELYNSRSTAQLAVLSACETGVGQYRGGAGVRSLANGFQYAGVPAVVTSLWKVPDESTSQIMQSFYGFLKNGKDKSKALNLAKKEYLKNTVSDKQRHPFYWAGFILMGNADPIDFSSGNNWIYYLLAGLLAVILLFVLRKPRLDNV